MTEAEWLSSTDPAAMLYVVQGPEPQWGGFPTRKISDRKLRLFAVACCRQVWHLLTDEQSRKAVEVAEQYADGLAMKEEADEAMWPIDWLVTKTSWATDMAVFTVDTRDALTRNIKALFDVQEHHRKPYGKKERAVQAALLRDIVGNPFRRYAWTAIHDCSPSGHELQFLDERWLTPTVLALTRAAYEERLENGALDNDRLAVLADALEDADCDSCEVLHHLRGQEVCWHCGGEGCDSCDEDGINCMYCGKVQIPLRGPHVRGCHVLDLLLGKE